MATYRVGIGSFNLKDGAVGLGTEASGLGNLKVEGTYKTTDLDVIGVSTFQRYAGFAADDVNIVRDTSLSSEHSTIGDIVVGLNSAFTVSAGATITIGAVESVSIGTHFSPPVGGVEERPEVPVEGTIRFNTDLNTLEFYNGVEWKQFTVYGGSTSGRAVTMGGYTGNTVKTIDYVTISTLGNAINFGDLNTNARVNTGGIASRTRGISAGGIGPGGVMNEIQYITTASAGNASDFGNLVGNYINAAGVSSQTRGIVLFGETPGASNVIQYIEISTTGNAVDFGDTTFTAIPGGNAGCCSPTRGLVGGNSSPTTGTIEAITISSKGNAFKFGDLSQTRYRTGGLSNSTRGVWGGGNPGISPVNYSTTIDYVTIASDGNAQDFGDILRGTNPGATSSSTRGILAGGYDNTSSPTAASLTNIINYITLSTLGDAMDFGDLSEVRGQVAVVSDSHGGLGGI